MFKNPIFFPMLILLSIGTASANDGNYGGGWLDVMAFSRSAHQALIRNLIESNDNDRGYIKSDEDFERLEIAVHDLNDDGVAEVIIYFGMTAYCGTAGCSMGIYQKIDGSWQRIGFGTGYVVWVGDQKLQGYRNLYSQGPDIWQWNGTEYRSSCELPSLGEVLPREVRVFVGRNCDNNERG